jgi:muconate cycloisomerase
MGIRDLKVKVGPDARANEAVLSLCRTILGAGCDLRVDANSTWAPAGVDEQARICERHGVRVIEQPFAAGSSEAGDAAARLLAARGFRVMADEGVLTAADVRTLASRGTAQMLNLRLSKNGGLVRLLSLAQEADACGLGYQLGCMVGETGILSCLGRVAASLLPHPVYLEGGYDDLLLEQNITVPSFGFGPGGKAEVVRAAGMGYRVDEERLTAFTRACLPV